MNPSPDVSVILVSYNAAAWLDRCLASLAQGSQQLDIDVVVVDNASRDGAATVAQRYAVRLLRNDVNVGFAAAVNHGVNASAGEWILLLNPDTEMRAGTIDRLVEFARAHPRHGLYGGRTVHEDGTLDPRSCWGEPSLWSTFCFATGLSTAFAGSRVFNPEALVGWPRDSVREVDIVSGALMLVSRATWDRLGGFDERFFVYAEDADLASRARAAGFAPVIVPDAVVVHAGGASSETKAGKLVLLLAGKLTYVDARWPKGKSTAATWLLRAGVALRAVGARVSRRGQPWQETWWRRSEWWNGFPPRPTGNGQAPAASAARTASA
jgi:N-acetylglucosaminyl-diphospho-decaprenol L-rhamnosyltransferase